MVAAVTQFFLAYGAWGLALASFLAGSLVPLPSEAVLIALVALGKSAVWMTAVATVGNVAGSSTLLIAGRSARKLALEKIRPATLERAERHFKRWGPGLLLFSWVPVVGDAFVLVAGAFNLPLGVALPLLTLGKGLRYAAVAAGTVWLRSSAG